MTGAGLPVTEKKYIIRVNMAQTMDGHTVLPGNHWNLGSAEDKRRMDKLREWADYLITGRNSIVHDNPNFYIRKKPDSPFHPRTVILLRDTAMSLPPQSRFWYKPHRPGVIAIMGASASDVEKFRDHLITERKHYMTAQNETLEEENAILDSIGNKWTFLNIGSLRDLPEMLPPVAGNRKKILLEGGPRLNAAFHHEDMIDEIYFTMVPYTLNSPGEDRILTSAWISSLQKFRLIHLERRKDEVFFRYKKIKGSGI